MPKVQTSLSPQSSRWSPAPMTTRDGTTPSPHSISTPNNPVTIPVTRSIAGPSQSLSSAPSEIPATPLGPNVVLPPPGLGDPAFPPSVADSTAALTDLRVIFESKSGDSKGEQLFYKRIGAMVQLLEASSGGEDWLTAAKRISPVLGRGNAWSLKLRRWTKDFIHDRSELPYPQSAFQGPPPYLDDEGLRDEVTWLLRENPSQISPKTVIGFLKDPATQARYHIHNHDVLTPAQARRWMADLGFFSTSSAGVSRRGRWVRNFED